MEFNLERRDPVIVIVELGVRIFLLERELMEWESAIRRTMDKIEPVEHTSELLCEVQMILGKLVGPLGTSVVERLRGSEIKDKTNE